jgi:Zn-dependent protease
VDRFTEWPAERVQWTLLGVLVLIISVALHEFGHAYMATRLGDDTPRRQGRVTLNPIAHIDPIGTLLLPILGATLGGGFGWGKPVQWQPHRIRRGIRMATATILVSIAGPGMNLVLAFVTAIVHVVLLWQQVIAPSPMSYGIWPPVTIDNLLHFIVVTNFILFFFNLIPFPPLDGGHIATSFMPYRHRDRWNEIAKYGPFIILAIVFIPKLAQIFVVPALWCANHLYIALRGIVGI